MNREAELTHQSPALMDKAQVVNSTATDIESYRRQVLETDFPKALFNGELVVYYQPRVSPAFSRVVGAEARVRWVHNDWGVIELSDLAPMGALSRMTPVLEDWLLNEVLGQLRLWRRDGLGTIPICIPISGERFLDERFVATVKTLISQYPAESLQLEISITESDVIYDEQMMRVLAEIQGYGVRIALDNFGTGFSSLSQLKRHGFTSIKIAKALVDELQTVGSKQAVEIQGIIKMAHVLGLKVVANGVETAQQVTVLRQTQCDEILGHFYSSPLSSHAFEEVLRKKIVIDKQANRIIRDRRVHHRFKMADPLIAEMTITSIREIPVAVKGLEVLVNDIGPGGIRFLSHVGWPCGQAITWRVNFLQCKDCEVLGQIVWKKELGQHLFEYGFQFLVKESTRADLTQTLNKLANDIEKGKVLTKFETFTGDPGVFFRGKNK